ncbi:carboxypeptidase D-like isoform X2 [Coccinella septempunctata]|uniref:carboxypeptidase D-like isoform X2 n=1 Tax=Coccinella septempunctata TaxID=41139 RepID=UPI001D07127B|nr:carboxypeptidase D-like isoform X2 [Coccinella septempunctata]
MWCERLHELCLTLLVFFCIVLECSCLTFKYHNNSELEQVLKNFTNSTTNIRTRLEKIGSSLNKIPLWAIELTAAEKDALGVPNIKLIGNIHGNEAVGREIILNFMEYLRTEYDRNTTIQWLLNNTRIHFLPTMNPDGFAVSHEGMCAGEYGRKNGKQGDVEDLNRNFPDFFHDNKIPRQPETVAVMNWMKRIPFILSAGLHGGAVVANYPFDTVKEETSIPINPPSLTPDDDVFRHLATVYSQNHLTMHKGVICDDGKKFQGGITNGAAWYPFSGGMQDYNYAKHGCMELTLEISCCKFPRASELPHLWDENKMALLRYVMEAHRGVTGQLLDSVTNEPVSRADLKIVGRNITFHPSNKGEFWRLLLPGNYQIQVDAPGYYPIIQEFSVKNFSAAELPSLTKMKILLLNDTIPTTAKPVTSSSSSTAVKWDFKETRIEEEEETTILEMNHFLRHFQYTADPNSEYNNGLKPNFFSCFLSMLVIEVFVFTIL